MSPHLDGALSYCWPPPCPCSGADCYSNFLPTSYCRSTRHLLVGYWALIGPGTSLNLLTGPEFWSSCRLVLRLPTCRLHSCVGSPLANWCATRNPPTICYGAFWPAFQ